MKWLVGQLAAITITSPVKASVFDPEDWLSKIFIRLWIWRHKACCCKMSRNQTIIDKFFIPIYEFMVISAAGLVLTSGQGRPHNVHLVRFEQR